MSTQLDQETQKLMGFHKKVTPEVSEYQNDPELWAFEYQQGPYLKHVKDDELLERYSSLLFNKNFLFNSWFFNAIGYFDRYSFLSKNYWLRKIFQTELELKSRNLQIPEIPVRTYKPMGEDQFVLVKYGKREFMERLLYEGNLRISPADTYDDSALDAARKDNELEKNWLIRGEEIKIKTADGKKIEAI